MQLADDVSFEIYFENIGEISFKEIIPNFFDRTSDIFFGKFRKIIIGIGLIFLNNPICLRFVQLMLVVHGCWVPP